MNAKVAYLLVGKGHQIIQDNEQLAHVNCTEPMLTLINCRHLFQSSMNSDNLMRSRMSRYDLS